MRTPNRRARILRLTSILTILSLFAKTAFAQTVTIRGIVFDSLAMKPAAGATVWLSGGTQIATADHDGRFELRDVAHGKRYIEFTSRDLDSLELGAFGLSVDAGQQGVAPITLATPSFATLWRRLCNGHTAPTSDSAVIWGTIRDAKGDTRLHGARMRFGWVEPSVRSDMKVEMLERTHDVISDSTGNYYACGMPVSTNLSVQASGTRSISSALSINNGTRKLVRLDLLVSAEMIGNSVTTGNAQAGSLDTFHRFLGTSIVRGSVRDEKQRPVVDALIAISAADSVVRTSVDGSFSLSGLPAGSHQLEVRKIGFAPFTRLLHLRPASATEIALSINTMSELAPVDVKGEAFTGRDRLDYEARRREGFGYALESRAIETKYDLQSALSQLPNITARRNRSGEVMITPPLSSMLNGCNGVTIWIDGVPGAMFEASQIPMQDFRAIEWYPRSGSAPARYAGEACGVLLFWTKKARWAK